MEKLSLKHFGIKKTVNPHKNIYKPDEIEPLAEETILEITQKAADLIRAALKEQDCGELVTLHISRNMCIARFDNNKETYVNFDGWKKL